ncbi:hypothetical protein, partial [Mitsuokella multacida]|uniref:hypothetical protein n=1 Tax=Mitsuokella multacida TaxID=52226 RepID=UPI00265998CF
DYPDIECVILGARIDEQNEHAIATICQAHDIKIRHMWLATIDSRIEFYTDKPPRFDGSSYRKYIDPDI